MCDLVRMKFEAVAAKKDTISGDSSVQKQFSYAYSISVYIYPWMNI